MYITLFVAVAHPDVHKRLSQNSSSPGVSASLAQHANVPHYGDYCDTN